MLPGPRFPKPALESDLLSQNQRLRDCLARDGAHVQEGQSGEHVRLLQRALNLVGEFDFTLPENGTFDDTMGDAVFLYKDQRKILNFSGKIDTIIGKLTITALDNELVQRNQRGRLLDPEEPPVSLKPQDIVIQIAGTGNLAQQGAPDPGGKAEFVGKNTPEYLKSHQPLVPLCFFGGRGGSDKSLMIADLASEVRRKAPEGRTIIIGISVGGLIAAKIASILTTRGVHLDYVAINDAALISHGGLQEVANFNPVTAVSVGLIKADRMDNFFQSFGHNLLKMEGGPQGFMPGTEFHGRFTNGPFINQPMDNHGKVVDIKIRWALVPGSTVAPELVPLSVRKKFADDAHVAAVEAAFATIDSVVDRLLDM